MLCCFHHYLFHLVPVFIYIQVFAHFLHMLQEGNCKAPTPPMAFIPLTSGSSTQQVVTSNTPNEQFAAVAYNDIHIVWRHLVNMLEIYDYLLQHGTLTYATSHTAYYEKTSSTKPEIHNTLHCHQENQAMTTGNMHRLEMWANAQRDGRSAEYRWRSLFNAAKFG